jgi:hypothetical protein
MHSERGLVVLVVVRLHRFDEADVVHALAQVREEIAHGGAAFSAGFELPAGAKENALLVRESAADAHRLAIRGEELGFWIKGIHVGDSAVGEDEDDALGFGGVVGRFWGEGIGGILGEELREEAGEEEGAADERAQDLTTVVERKASVHGRVVWDCAPSGCV